MRLFKDIITGEELFTDACNPQVEDDFLFVIQAKLKTFSTGGETFDTGANPSAEGDDADAGVDDATSYSKLDFVELYKLKEQPLKKKDVKEYLKVFVKKLSTHIEKKVNDEGKDGAAAKSEFESQIKTKLSTFLAKCDKGSDIYAGPDFDFEDKIRSFFIFNWAPDGVSGVFYCVKPFMAEEKL